MPKNTSHVAMSQVIFATVEDGMLKPDRDISLSPGTRVRITLEQWDDPSAPSKLACDELDELCDEIPITSHGVRLTRDQLHE
jgi:predicted DNA-binding antitoxin AbrB/MazE fold protein